MPVIVLRTENTNAEQRQAWSLPLGRYDYGPCWKDNPGHCWVDEISISITTE